MEEVVFSSGSGSGSGLGLGSGLGSEMPWYWIIETLSRSHLDGLTPLLFELVSKAPPSNSDSAKKAREALALRCLNELSKCSSNDGIPHEAGKGFNLSESCDDVLQRILDENSVHDMQKDISNELKRDIRSFVEQKKASMPRSTLHSLKNAIVSGTNPLVTSLKEISGIILPNNQSKEKPSVPFDTNGEQSNSDYEQERQSPKANGKHEQKSHTENIAIVEKMNTSLPQNNVRENVDIMGNVNVDNDVLPREIDLHTKLSLLGSQCSLDEEDSLTLADSDINLCMKCNKGGGELLICGSSSCPLAFHESCLGCSVTFDDQGSFYCPFCAYSRAISEYAKAKKQASLARHELSLFIGGRDNCKRAKKDYEVNCQGQDDGVPNEVTRVANSRKLRSLKR